MPINLLPHNVQPYIELEAMLIKSNKAMLVAATGAGKTSISMKYLLEHNLHALVVCPKVSVCEQWKENAAKYDCPITAITYHRFLSGIDVNLYDCIIFDEAHHTGASAWGAAVKRLMSTTSKPIIGLTADPKRYLDGGRDMGQELWDGNIMFGLSMDEAIAQGVLPDGIFVTALCAPGYQATPLCVKRNTIKRLHHGKEIGPGQSLSRSKRMEDKMKKKGYLLQVL